MAITNWGSQKLSPLHALVNCAFIRHADATVGCGLALRDRLGAPLSLDEQENYDRQMERARLALGQNAVVVARAEGSILTWEQATAYALEQSAEERN